MHSIRFEHRRARGWPAMTRVMSRDCRAGGECDASVSRLRNNSVSKIADEAMSQRHV